MVEPADNRSTKLRRRRRYAIAALSILAVVFGAWAVWHHEADRPKVDMTLDLGNGVQMKFVLIPAGKFMMGSPATEKDRQDDEGPPHDVRITKPFYMGIYTVTQEQYVQVMGTNPSTFTGEANPVDTVTWDEAAEFCGRLSNKTGRRVTLPTEAQWEYACRAGTTTAFNTGEHLTHDQASFSHPGQGSLVRTPILNETIYLPKDPGKTMRVGHFAPNSFGLYDMHGNVREWCRDWYADDFYARSPKSDPVCLAEGRMRVMRGGSWFWLQGYCRSAMRFGASLQAPHTDLGFRVVVEVAASEAASKPAKSGGSH